MLFGIAAAIVLIALITNFFWQTRIVKIDPVPTLKNLVNDITADLLQIKKIRPNRSVFNTARKSFNSLSSILFLIMAVTGVSSSIFGVQMQGVLLLIHVICAPLFVVSITISILLFAHKLQFNAKDYEYISSGMGTRYKLEFWKKVYFWLFSFVVIFTIISVLLAMYPVFDTTGQNWLLNIHRFSALALLIFTANYITLKYTLKK